MKIQARNDVFLHWFGAAIQLRVGEIVDLKTPADATPNDADCAMRRVELLVLSSAIVVLDERGEVSVEVQPALPPETPIPGELEFKKVRKHR